MYIYILKKTLIETVVLLRKPRAVYYFKLGER